MNDINQEEQLIEEMIYQSKSGSLNLSKKDPRYKTGRLITSLNKIPKRQLPIVNYSRIKERILDRITMPQEQSVSANWFIASLPRILKLSGSVLASMLVVISMGIGTTVASLDSLPGEPLYPLKTAIEKLQLRFASSEHRTDLQIKFANNRLEELDRVIDEGKLSEQELEKILIKTAQDINQTAKVAAEASTSAAPSKKVSIINKLVDLNSKTEILKSASISTEGEVKLELEKTLAETKLTQEEAIDNIERAGLKIEAKPISIEASSNQVLSAGKITSITSTTLSIGTAKFLLTKDTQYINVKREELKVDSVVSIEAEVKDEKTYVVKLTLTQKAEQPPSPPDTPQSEVTQ